jgi:hypothetical protein
LLLFVQFSPFSLPMEISILSGSWLMIPIIKCCKSIGGEAVNDTGVLVVLPAGDVLVSRLVSNRLRSGM